MRKVIFLTLLLTVSTALAEPSHKKIQALYNSLDPSSISQHLAFYNLYTQHPAGQQALLDAWQLMGSSQGTPLPFQSSVIDNIVALVNKRAEIATPELDEQTIATINTVAAAFPNRYLKGFDALSEEEVLSLPCDQIDLCRGLLLSELGNSAPALKKIRSYEAMIDLMALQIQARLPKNATGEEKVHAINRFVFEEQGYRFPPHSLYAKEIDEYTFLPSVLDSRRGVCLGVSILYICFAQRLGLPLEMITPPGHIYVRYRDGSKTLNIETTARGIHIETEEYLGLATKKLQERNIKEVIGCAHFNKASGYLQNHDYIGAQSAYKKAELYLPEDPLVQELLAYTYLFLGDHAAGRRLLAALAGKESEFQVGKTIIGEEFLTGDVDEKGIEAIMMPVDETRSSILEKCQELQAIVTRYPRFRAGHFSLAITWLQLHRAKEAVEVLTHYCQLCPEDPTAHYYLATLHFERLDDNKAWKHLHLAEKILSAASHTSKPLKQIRKALTQRSPE